MIRSLERSIAVAACASLFACAPRANDGAAVAAETPPAVPSAPATPAAAAPPADPAAPTVPSAQAIAAAEESRVGSLRTLHARGVAELRWSDADGNHFEQGDADVRWCAGRGIAASISKFGDRYAWLGSDGTRWWRFELKSEPTNLVFGSLASGGSSRRVLDAQAASPRFLGIAPLRPLPGAAVALRDGLAWVELALDAPLQGAGTRCEAGFDPRSLEPRRVRLAWGDGAECSVEFGELLSVETAGAAPGAWPRIPRRLTAARAGEAVALSISLDSASADPEGADRPALYDLDLLRARFSPSHVEEAQ